VNGRRRAPSRAIAFERLEDRTVLTSLTLTLAASGGPTLTIPDGSPMDMSPIPGRIVFDGPIGNFTDVTVTVTSKPNTPSPAEIDISANVVSSQAAGGTLTITASDKDYTLTPGTGTATLVSHVGGTNGTGGSTTSFQSYADPGNALFAKSVSSGLQGPFSTPSFNSDASAPVSINGLFSLTAVAVVTMGPGTASSFGSVTKVTPPTVATPSINTVAGGTVVIGSGAKLNDTAVLSGGNNPTGTITFTLFSPSNVAVYTDVVTVTGNGTYSTATMGNHAGGYLPTVTGTYKWTATYTSGDSNNTNATDNGQNESEVVIPSTPVGPGEFATIGFWHNPNGQAVINGFNNGPTDTQLGNWLAKNFPHLFGAPNPYDAATLASFGATTFAGLTNAQVATVYANLWNPSGVTKNTYVQAFAVALGAYADTPGLGFTPGGPFTPVPGGGLNLTFDITGNTDAFPGLGSNPTVGQILMVVDANFDPTTGLFYGGDQTKTSEANNVLDGINTQGDIH
jgi:hypothetical protein